MNSHSHNNSAIDLRPANLRRYGSSLPEVPMVDVVRPGFFLGFTHMVTMGDKADENPQRVRLFKSLEGTLPYLEVLLFCIGLAWCALAADSFDGILHFVVFAILIPLLLRMSLFWAGENNDLFYYQAVVRKSSKELKELAFMVEELNHYRGRKLVTDDEYRSVANTISRSAVHTGINPPLPKVMDSLRDQMTAIRSTLSDRMNQQAELILEGPEVGSIDDESAYDEGTDSDLNDDLDGTLEEGANSDDPDMDSDMDSEKETDERITSEILGDNDGYAEDYDREISDGEISADRLVK